MADKHISGFLYALSGAALFSFKPVLIKLAYLHSIDTVTLLTLRMLMSLPFYVAIGLWVYFRNHYQVSTLRNSVPPTILVGILGYYLASYLDMLGLTLISAQLERLILFTYPTIVVVLGMIFFRQHASGNIWISLLLTYTGVASIVAHDMTGIGSNVIEGTVMIFGSAICFALFMVLSSSRIKQIGSRLFTAIAMSSSSVIILCHFGLTHTLNQLLVSKDVLLIIAGIAIISTVLPSFLISAAIKQIGPGQVSLIGSIGPAITSLLAINILDEKFTSFHATGMILILFGVFLSRTKKP